MTDFHTKVKLDDVRAIKETDAALLCDINGEEIWIPKSQIDDDSEVWQEGDDGVLIISEFIAEKKGLA